MRRLTISVALIATLLLASVPLSAQSTPGDWSVLKAVPSGTSLEVKFKAGNTVKGKLTSVSDTGLSLSVKNKTVDIKHDDVLNIYQTSHKSATTSTLIGLGVGAGSGAALGGVASATDNNNGFERIDHVATAGLAVVGAGVGALVGYLIGRSGRKRVLVYASK